MKNPYIVNMIRMKKTKKIKNILLTTTLLFTAINSPIYGQEDAKIKDLSVSFYSNIFHEKREIKIQHIYLEKDSLKQNIPILLVLDADVLFNLTSSIVNFLELSQEYPPFLLVGLSNTNRQGELVGDFKNKFAQFINEDVDSVLTAVFPNRGTLSVIGHSFSADFILKNSVKDISSACILSGVTSDFSFVDKKSTSYFCYSGDEDYENRLGFIKEIDSLKRTDSNKATNIITKIFKDREHFDIPMSGIGSYIKSYYRQYVSLNERDFSFITSSENKLDAIIKVITDKKQALKIDYMPSVEAISIFSEIVDSTQFETVFKYLLSMNLDETALSFTHYFLGDFYEKENRLKEALTQYELMYSYIPEWVSNKEQLYENIERIKEKISDNKKQQKIK